MNIADDGPSNTATGVVVLEHTGGPDGFHYDWMIERPGVPDERRLLTFRCETRPDRAGSSPIACVRIGDHRAVYLTHEGDLGGGRGRVRRVARGACTALTLGSDRCACRVDWGDGPVDMTGRRTRVDGGVEHWVFGRA